MKAERIAANHGRRPTAAARIGGLFGAAGIAVVSVAVGTNPQVRWLDPLGVATHLALLPFAAALPAPSWGRAMGYSWLAADTAISVASLNGADPRAADRARLGGHVLAAAWILSAARRDRRMWVRRLGLAAGSALGGHSFVAPLTKRPVLLITSGPLLVGWLVASALGDASVA